MPPPAPDPDAARAAAMDRLHQTVKRQGAQLDALTRRVETLLEDTAHLKRAVRAPAAPSPPAPPPRN